jgi:hypothetical protein
MSTVSDYDVIDIEASTYFSSYSPLNFLGITNRFSYVDEFRERRILPNPRERSLTIRSISPIETDTLMDGLWLGCQPLQYQTIYTPGFCPEEYELHSIVALRFPGNNSITEWNGCCCRR